MMPEIIVEIRHIGTDLNAATAELQHWLDARSIHPAAVEHSCGGPGITFRVQFDRENEARVFADRFHGCLNSGDKPDDVARW